MKLRALLTGFVGLLALILLTPPLMAALKQSGPHAHLFLRHSSLFSGQFAHSALHAIEVTLGILLFVYMISFTLPTKAPKKTTPKKNTFSLTPHRKKANDVDLFFNAKN